MRRMLNKRIGFGVLLALAGCVSLPLTEAVRNADAKVRLEAVNRAANEDDLLVCAVNTLYLDVKMEAFCRLSDPIRIAAVLGSFSTDELSMVPVLQLIRKRFLESDDLQVCKITFQYLQSDEGLSSHDAQVRLAKILVDGDSSGLRKRMAGLLSDPKVICALASEKFGSHESLAKWALRLVYTQADLVDVCLSSMREEIQVAAIMKIYDDDILRDLAQRGPTLLIRKAAISRFSKSSEMLLRKMAKSEIEEVRNAAQTRLRELEIPRVRNGK